MTLKKIGLLLCITLFYRTASMETQSVQLTGKEIINIIKRKYMESIQTLHIQTTMAHEATGYQEHSVPTHHSPKHLLRFKQCEKIALQACKQLLECPEVILPHQAKKSSQEQARIGA